MFVYECHSITRWQSEIEFFFFFFEEPEDPQLISDRDSVRRSCNNCMGAFVFAGKFYSGDMIAVVLIFMK